MRKRAVVLLSGGLDSATTCAIALEQGFDCYALTCLYGQRHRIEIESAKKIAQALRVADHRIIKMDPVLFEGSALTDTQIAVPKDRSDTEMSDRIPVTYVPARNTIFLSLALAWAEILKAYDIFIGVNAMDYSGYPDCRPEFIDAFERMANLATVAAVTGVRSYRIHTPVIKMTKGQIIHKGLEFGVDYSLTHSCYDPDAEGRACGHCDSCILRLKGFAEANVKDPIEYIKQE